MESLVDTIKKGTGAADFSATPVSTSFFQVGDVANPVDGKGTYFLTRFVEEGSEKNQPDFFHIEELDALRQIQSVFFGDNNQVGPAVPILYNQDFGTGHDLPVATPGFRFSGALDNSRSSKISSHDASPRFQIEQNNIIDIQ